MKYLFKCNNITVAFMVDTGIDAGSGIAVNIPSVNREHLLQ